MVSQTDAPLPLLVQLLGLIDQLPLAWVPSSAARRGRPCLYSERLFVKAVVVMVVRHLPTVHALWAVLEQPEMAAVRTALCGEYGALPSRRTFERRLTTLSARLPAQIAALGAHLLGKLDPWATEGRAVAIDSTPLHARGGVWHKRHREAGEIPHTSIDTQAHWTKSGWHGWVYGYRLQVAPGRDGGWRLAAAGGGPDTGQCRGQRAGPQSARRAPCVPRPPPALRAGRYGLQRS